jgi:hypothetical protein
MNCNCNLHRATNLTTAGVLTVTDSNNIANLMPFDLVLCLNPSSVITGAPVNYTITVNGVAIPLLNKVALPISTDHLMPRKRYHGYYIVPTTGGPYVILVNTPCDLAYAVSSASVAVTTDETTGG